jgi:CheY-like chemotaxis protein
MSAQNAGFVYVEDDPLSREALSLVWRLLGIKNLWVFEDSTNFMDRVRGLPARPDVFMLDIHVRPHNGFEMLSLLRASSEYRECKVIALTASVMNEEISMLRERGFNGAIGKPIDIDSMPVLIERVLRNESVWHIM